MLTCGSIEHYLHDHHQHHNHHPEVQPHAHLDLQLQVQVPRPTIRIDIQPAVQGVQREPPTASSPPASLRYGDKNGSRPQHQHVANNFRVSSDAPTSIPTSSPSDYDRSPESMFSAQSPVQPPSLTVQLEGIDRTPRSFAADAFDSTASASSPPQTRSKSPGTKLTSFFGWKSSSPQLGGQSPTTTFSDHSASPAVSLSPHKMDSYDAAHSNMEPSTPALDTHVANQPQIQYFDVPGTPLLSATSTVDLHVEELERELHEVSAELAASIRREMDLEDEVERCRADLSSMSHDHHNQVNRRGSDYYSDSGASSLRFPLGDSDAKIDELERMRRKVEQEKAQMRVDYAQKLAQELRHRKDLEAQLHTPVAEERIRELETNLDDARRRLSQERKAKDNFEDLFAALREESAKHRNERDNLREEIVPQLKARIEGLEAEAAQVKAAQYDHARLQQEIEALRVENRALQDALPGSSKCQSIAEDDVAPASRWLRIGLSRSNSPARVSSQGNVKGPGSGKEGRNRSESISNEKMKGVEEQRDALHIALKNLLRRFEGQRREHSKAMRRLVADRDRARSAMPARIGYSREVHFLREEIGMLRRRADDALEHKWQAENNISGVKMALDRAQQETRSLRDYLTDRQSGLIRTPPRARSASGLGISLSGEDSETSGPEIGEDERHAMIKVLRKSIQLAEHERDAALREAEAYRERARALQNTDDQNVDKEKALANELLAAAGRMEELAAQVQRHLQSNMELRQRLTDAVTKGERQQLESTARITNMQSRLKEMEDNVMQAQHQSEQALGTHEESAKMLNECNSPLLSRFHGGVPGNQRHSLLPKSPIPGQGKLGKSPVPTQGGTGQGESLFEATKTAVLERKVKELEAALVDADSEMREVVERINASQYEIAALQSERDEANRLMRSLQRDIAAEREKTVQLMG